MNTIEPAVIIDNIIGNVAWNKVLASFFVLLFTLFVRKLFDRYLRRLMETLAQKTTSQYDDLLVDAISKPISAIIITIGTYYALLMLQLPNAPYNIRSFVDSTFRIAVSVLVIWMLYRLSNLLARFMTGLFSRADREMASQFAPLITQAVKVTILAVGILLVIQNLGYSVGSVLTGLGIGGLAVALAAQDTLANLFGTLVMLVDRPFQIGDWVQFKDIDGNVESIGFRSTKVRTWSKSVKIVPNKLLTSEIIENWSKMPKRRVKMTIGVTYSSTPDKIVALRDSMEQILRDDSGVDPDYMLVYFNDFGPSSLELFVYYFTRSTVWKEYLETRQRINLKFLRAVEELGLSFAFPSQTLYFGDKLPIHSQDSDSPDDHGLK
ncbi:mechanosensitive ion channel family protein [bacterium]|nr:mechanosensitive ion channel family protein [candidate division CSSED10-310 bacterium]